MNSITKNENIFFTSSLLEVIGFSKILQFDVIVFDISFHDLKNYSIFNELKKIQPKTKILIFTRAGKVSFTEVELLNDSLSFNIIEECKEELDNKILSCLYNEEYRQISSLYNDSLKNID